MYDFILQMIVMLSLGVIIYLIARVVPRVTENATAQSRKDYLGELIKKLPLEKADALISFLLEKWLRKLKIAILKLDNFLAKHLQSLKKDGVGSIERPNIFEESGQLKDLENIENKKEE